MGSWTNTLLTKSANYTVANGDDGDTIVLSAASLFTLTYGAPAGYSSNHVNRVMNPVSSARGVLIAISGFTTFVLYPGQSMFVFNFNGSWAYSDPGRWRPTSNITLYVNSSSGSDTAADGLATGAGAFATVTHAVTVLYDQIDLTSLTGATISVGAAVSEQLLWAGTIPGPNFDVAITGGTYGSPVAWTLAGNPSSSILALNDYCTFTFTGFSFGFTGSGQGLSVLTARQLSTVIFQDCTFGNCIGGAMIGLLDGAYVGLQSHAKFTGNCTVLTQLQNQGMFSAKSCAIDMTANPSIGIGFYIVGPAMMDITNSTISGSPTGQQYNINDNGVLNAGTYSWPGSMTAGATATGGRIL
jgi:hypothetical protein